MKHRGTTIVLLWLGVFVVLSVLCAAVVVAEEAVAADEATLTIDAFDTEYNFRQSFCDRYALLYDDTSYLSMLASNSTTNGSEAEEEEAAEEDALLTTIENVLSGTQLNLIIADDSVHFNYEEESGINTTVPGLHADILDYIAEQSNFTWRKSFGISYYADIQAPETFTTFLDWSNERYDMVIDYWAPTLERMQQGATFTEAYINGDMILIHNQYTPLVQKIDWWNWIKPFTPDVWYATLATIVISAMIYPWIEFMGGDLDDLLTVRKWITGRLYLSFINFTGNYAYEPKTPGGCLFGVVFAFWSMLMLASYTANLASLLVVKRVVPPPVINELQDAIDHSMSMCYPQGTFAADYLAELYPPNIMSEMFIPVPDTAADKYGALNNGTCDFLIDWRNSYDIVKHQQDYNPDCQLIQEGRIIKTIEFTFATMLDPAQKCTLLLKEVFNYYLIQMKDSGKLEELWQDHISSQSDPGHCDSTYGDNTRRNTKGGESEDDDGTDDEDEDEDDATATRRRRSLKGGGRKANAAASSSVLSLEEETGDSTEEMALTITDMGGIFLLQVIGALVAILFTVFSYLENKYLRDKKAVHVKRYDEGMRQAQLLEQHPQHQPPTTHRKDDIDIVDDDDAKYGYDHGSISRPQYNRNRETTLSTIDGSSFQSGTNSDSSTTHHLFLNNSDDNGTDDVHDDDDDDNDECSRQDSSTRLPRRPSFNSKKNKDREREREQEHRSRQRENQSLDHVQQRLHHLQSSHEELKQQYDGLKHQNETIISLLANMTVVSQNNNSLD